MLKSSFDNSSNIQNQPLEVIYKKGVRKDTLMQFENLPICLCSYKNNTLKISHF